MTHVLKQFEVGPMGNMCYLIGDGASKEAFVVDPGWEPEKIMTQVTDAGMTLKGFLATHVHYDHVNALTELLKKHRVPVYAHTKAIEHANAGGPLVASLGPSPKPLNEGEVIKLGETEIKFFHTPGHSPGSQCILIGNQLLTGDTLFIGGCGRTDLPGGSAEDLVKSLKRLAGFSPETEIFPGHGYGPAFSRTLKEELEENPYLNSEYEAGIDI